MDKILQVIRMNLVIRINEFPKLNFIFFNKNLLDFESKLCKIIGALIAAFSHVSKPSFYNNS